MRLTGETKLFLGVIIATIAIVAGGIVLLSRPAPVLTRSELVTSDTRTRGNPDAKVYLVEFSDFQCPACKEVKPTIDGLVGKYKDNLIYGYKNYPLPQHPFAVKAAIAAEAAGQQGKYWEMYDLLFENQEKLSDPLITELAKQLKLDISQFEKSRDDPVIKEKISKDKAFGDKIGIDSTPTFYLNGKKMQYFSYGDLSKTVDQAIQSK